MARSQMASGNTENRRHTDHSYFLILSHSLQLISAHDLFQFPVQKLLLSLAGSCSLFEPGPLNFPMSPSRISKALYSLHKEPETHVCFEPWPHEINLLPPTSCIIKNNKCLLTLPVTCMILQNFLINPPSNLFSKLQMHRSHFIFPFILDCKLSASSSSHPLLSNRTYGNCTQSSIYMQILDLYWSSLLCPLFVR